MCECQNTTNEMLKKYNAALQFSYFGEFRAFVQTIKLDEKKRGKRPLMLASYCPFCGEKYPAAEEKEQS